MRSLVAEHIEKLKPYVPGKPIEETQRELGLEHVIKLASNENPLGPSPRAVEAMASAVREVHLYPDGSCFHLVRALAAHLSVDPGQVFVAAGSNEIIELIIRTFMLRDDAALLTAGSFIMYKVALQAHGRHFVEVPMREGYRYDLAAMAKALPGMRVVFLANPDNPTGTAFDRAELDAFLAQVPKDTLVVLDEAYFEYVDWADYPNGVELFRKHENLIVLRTFSKIYGLAGVRLGYGVMNAPLAGYLNRTRMPFNVSSLAQVAGVAALEDTEHVHTTREHTIRGMRYLETELRALGLTVPHSHANFVLVDLGRPALPVYEALLHKGLITRPVPHLSLNTLRISVGLQRQNEQLIAGLREVL
jgi:histidinol-phosphate aminotransferase